MGASVKPLLVMAVLAAALAPCRAAERTFTGGADSAWSDPAAWGGAAIASGDELIFAGPAGRNDLAPGIVVAGLRTRADLTIAGVELQLSGRIVVEAGTCTLACPLALGAPSTAAVASGATLIVAAPIDTRGHAFTCEGDGAIALNASLVGEGSLTTRCARLTLAAASAFTGAARVHGGAVVVAAAAPASGAGAFGAGAQPVEIAGARVELAADCARALAIGEGGVRIAAVGGARRLSGTVASPGWAAGTITGSYVAQLMRTVTSDDWRASLPIAGTRADPRIFFPDQSFGTPAERAAWTIGGNDHDWDAFAVQWDGFLRVSTACDLATASDDGSRVWLDRDLDGTIDAGEWGANGWGSGQGTTCRVVHAAVAPGIYRIRVQYEEGHGGNACSLLWSDAAVSGGQHHGMHIVPPQAFLHPALIELAADAGATLTVDAALGGEGMLLAHGPGRVVVSGPAAGMAGFVAAAGDLELRDATLAAPVNLTIARDARLTLAGAATIASLSGEGTLIIGGDAAIAVPGGRELRFAGRIDGEGGVRKTGVGGLTLSGETAWRGATVVDEGALHLVARGQRIATTTLRSPLTTIVAIPDAPASGGLCIDADIVVPADAPDDLGVGAFIADRHGRWWQDIRRGALPPGRHRVRFMLTPDRSLAPEAHRGGWTPAAAAVASQAGVFFWSQQPSSARLRLETSCRAVAPEVSGVHRLSDLAPQGTVGGVAHGVTGERWQLTCNVHPAPANPYDAGEFQIDAVFTHESGAVQRVPGFWLQPMRSRDRGDEEELTPDGQPSFAVRFRPRLPGRYAVALEARWRDSALVRVAAPPLAVAGARWDQYVRVDPGDARFFTVDGAFYWPIGLNIRSVNDPRGRDALGSRLTPDRGSLSYAAYFARLAAGGGTAAELWMSAWNLAIEWRQDWRGYYGQGRYSDANAAKLDRVLDSAWAHGLRINLVVHNHGQGSDGTDHEWENSPYNRAAGGRLDAAREFFTDAWALAGQENHRRYLCARWADHPAVLGWKLWSEVNLTAAGGNVVPWHERALARWQELDGYDHPLTTHWAGDYTSVDHGTCALPALSYICIDAYHSGRVIAELLGDSLHDPGRGLARFAKPMLVTEYGGSPGAGPAPQIMAELASAPWSAFVSGHAGSPMLWWYEWVDQGDRWLPYAAIGRFAAGEDPRGADTRSIALTARSPAGALWSRAWFRPGRLLGYVLDRHWGGSGAAATRHDAGEIVVGGDVAGGAMRVHWWDADRGEPLLDQRIDHPGGELVIRPPPFERHIAFKLTRESDAPR
ncbi:MAG TPA: DUF5060 domain-containing protein [Planctomycetota bacterium]|nr:DUF5060 domain-containing protein [Planctomycetota bacterium]